MSKAVSVQNVSKRYRLGSIGSRSAAEDLCLWWLHRVLRRPVPAPIAGSADHGNRDGDTIWALRDVSLDVEEGEVIGIIGKNGAGKSTLLKILSRITAPTDGEVLTNGRLASLLEVGTGFSGELTGRENIFLNGSILGMAPQEIRRRFDEIVAFAELEDFIETPVKRYSSGMFVRLAFAVAAHLDTEILVVDEILAVGDIGFQRKCLGKMGEASSTGKTVLFVSHRMDHISALCPRSVVLEAGRLIFDGKTDDALGHYYRQFDQMKPGAIRLRLDRKGRGRARIIDAWLEDASGRRVETVTTGQTIAVRMHIKNMTDQPLRNLNAGAGIFTLTNMFAASLSTQEGGIHSFDLENEIVISLRISRLPLNQGQFYFNCVVRSASGAYEFDDLVENVMVFVVDYGDFHGIGQSSGGFMSIAHHATLASPDARSTGIATEAAK